MLLIYYAPCCVFGGVLSHTVIRPSVCPMVQLP